MKLKISIVNKSLIRINKKQLRRIVQKIFASLKQKYPSELEIALVSPVLIRKLNKDWRQKNQVTTVLSFVNREIKHKFISAPSKYEYLGEIFLCPAEIRKQAKISQISTEEMMTKIIAHAILHLLGYKHSNKKDAIIMEQKEKEILNKILQL